MNGHKTEEEARRGETEAEHSAAAGPEYPPVRQADGPAPSPARLLRPELLARAASQVYHHSHASASDATRASDASGVSEQPLSGAAAKAMAAEELSRAAKLVAAKAAAAAANEADERAPPLEAVVKNILTSSVYAVAKESPLSPAPILSARLANRVLIKREDLQAVYSFKLRGAYNLMSKLTAAQKSLGVLAASAGNHAQGVALAAKELGVSAVIVMPTVTPSIKVNAVRARGATVVLHGDCFDDALEHCMQLLEESGRLFIPPYDHLDIIAGQGTVGMEILRQIPGRIDAIFVPVGGGGLISGIGAYVKYLRPEIKVIGVESVDSACLKAALDAGERVRLKEVGVFADGVSVALVGKNPWNLIHTYGLVDDVITCTADEMCAAVKDVFEDTRGVCEPAGALSIAGMKKYVAETGATNETLVCINSGANTNFDRLRHIAERTELGEKREAILAITFTEAKGRFLSIVKAFGKRLCTECVYRRDQSDSGQLYLGVRVEPDSNDRASVIAALESDPDLTVYDLTEDELAKQHIRHLGGGRGVPGIDCRDEILYRFEFPERPGALLRFVERLPTEWSVTLFHYRNHGTAHASVLMGLLVPEGDRKKCIGLFENIGYRFWNESDNLSYKLFIRPRDVTDAATITGSK